VEAEIEVAILETEELLRRVVEEHLNARGFRVVISTGNPMEFVELFRQLPTRLTLIDLREEQAVSARMLGLLGALREARPQVRNVLLAGGGADREIDEAFAHGAAAFIDKRRSHLRELVPLLTRVAAGETVRPVRERLFSLNG
jgi:DNA-binding NarL/FixJ family response regulator